MTRLVHLLAVLIVVAAVTSGLKVDGGKTFLREFVRSTGTLVAFYAGVGAVVFLAAWFLGHIN